MYKEIFKRMMPYFFGSLIGVFIVALIFWLLGLEDTLGAVRIAVITFVVNICVQFFFIRKNFIKEHLQTHTVVTPLPVVYVNKHGKLYNRPYLDLNHLSDVWGVLCGNLCISASSYRLSPFENPLDVTDYCVTNGCAQKILNEIRLPSRAELQTLAEWLMDRDEFDKTIRLLQEHEVNAEYLYYNCPYACIDGKFCVTPFMQYDGQLRVRFVSN